MRQVQYISCRDVSFPHERSAYTYETWLFTWSELCGAHHVADGVGRTLQIRLAHKTIGGEGERLTRLKFSGCGLHKFKISLQSLRTHSGFPDAFWFYICHCKATSRTLCAAAHFYLFSRVFVIFKIHECDNGF